MKIIESIVSRYHSFLNNHFELTRWGHNLRALKGIHKGERCFIIGNGPSLKASDLDRLCDEHTFAFNRIFYIFDQTKWRPTFYMTQDSKLIRNSIEGLSKTTTKYKFIPIAAKWFDGYKELSTDYFFASNPCYGINEIPDFSINIPHSIVVANTVVYSAIQLAVYMGFNNIYLLGVDHKFHISQNNKGEIFIDKNAKDYFCDQYNQDQNELFIPMLDQSTNAFWAAKRFADSHGINIYNATRGGKLEVFERKDFDSLFCS